MRPHVHVRVRGAAMALGAICTVTTLAPAAPAAAQTTPSGAPSADLERTTLRYGQDAVVRGRAGGGGSGTPVTLEYRPRGGQWSSVATGRTGSDGRYRLAVALSRSGALRVVTGGGAQARQASAPAARGTASTERAVAVAARISTSRRQLDVNAGRSAVVEGAVRRPRSGREVRLQRREGRGWATIATDRTDAQGRYRLTHRTRGAGSTVVRVRSDADELNAATTRELGRLNAYRSAVASWYGPGFYGRRTACGQTFSASIMGVAHRSLPCGTRLTVRYRGRSAQVRVIDRGPFVGNREFDLGVAVKRRIGFGSTGTVQVSR